MGTLVRNSREFEKRKDGSESVGVGTESLSDSVTESRGSRSSGSSSDVWTDEGKAKGSSSPPRLGWPIRKADVPKCLVSDVSEDEQINHSGDSKFKKLGPKISGQFCCFGFKLRLVAEKMCRKIK